MRGKPERQRELNKIIIIKNMNFKKIKKFFKKKDQTKVLYNVKPKKASKKRKHIKISFEFLRHFELLKRKNIPYFLICLAFLVIISITLIIWPFFRVKYIEITKKDNITNMDIAYKALENLRWQQMFKMNELDIFNRLKNYQENIQSVELNLSLPSTIKIKIGSHKEVFNIIINEKSYILLENGAIIPSNHSKNLKLLNTITNIDKNKFIEYKQVFKPIYIRKISNILKRFEQNFLNIQIKDLYYYEIWKELHIELESGTLLIFSIDDNALEDVQIEKLAIFNKDHFEINNWNFVYIDLRVNNKIFYCSVENKVQCDANLRGIYGEN